MNIIPYIFIGDKREVDKSSKLTTILPSSLSPLRGASRESVNILRPAINIDLKELRGYDPALYDLFIKRVNYFYIEEFERYYYVHSVELLNLFIYRVYLEVDPLYSFKDGIKALSCFVDRSYSSYNPLQADNSIPLDMEKEITEYTFGSTTNVDLEFKTDIDDNAEPPALNQNYHIVINLLQNTPTNDIINLYDHTINTSAFLDACSTRCYELTSYGAYNLIGELTTTASAYSSFFKSLIAYPFILDTHLSTNDSNIVFDYYNNGIHTYTMATKGTIISSMSRNFCVADFDLPTPSSFLDLEPYAQYELYLPFVGWVKFPYSENQGSNIRVYYAFNHTDGTANIQVVNHNLQVIIYSTGAQVGIPLSLSSTNAQELATQRNAMQLNLIMSLVSSAVGVAGGVAKGNVLLTAGAAMKGVSALVDYNNASNRMFERAQSTPNGSVGALYNPLKPILRKSNYPIKQGLTLNDYAKDHGGVTNEILSLSALSGFTIISNPILDNIVATETEKNAIIDSMHQGIIL